MPSFIRQTQRSRFTASCARAALLAVLSTAVLASAGPAPAQEATGRIVGRVLDAASGQGLPGARVTVVDGPAAVVSGVDGRFTLDNVPAGTHGVSATLIGYGTKTVTGVPVPQGGAARQDITLASQALALEGLTVTASAERGSITRALDQQRTATGIVNSTSTEQIARTPDSNAAQAVQRVSGVTVEDGKFVFVRGLGERYTTTSLNGSRVPSPEPEKKVVPLDLFPATLLESITTSKTFTPDQPGDFSGAQVNLQTKSFPGRRVVSYSVTGGWNAAATGEDVLAAPTVGGEWLGFATGDRELPGAVAGQQSFPSDPANRNLLIRSFRNAWVAEPASGAPNVSTSVSVGGEGPVFGQRVGYVGSLTYSRKQEVRRDEIQALAQPGAEGEPLPLDVFRGSTGTTSVLWGGILNLSTFFGPDNKISFNNTYDRGADNRAHQDWGTLEEFAQIDSIRRTTLQYVERSVRSNQLRGEHVLPNGNELDWSVTSSGVTRDEPDRSDLLYGTETAPQGGQLPLAWLGFLAGGAKRTFAHVQEDVLGTEANYALTLGGGDGKLRFGGAYRHTSRDANTEAYNIRSIGLTAEQRALPPEQLFDGRYTEGSQSSLFLEPNSNGGSYQAREHLPAAYLMADYGFGDRFQLVGGARVEHWRLGLDCEPVSGSVVNASRNDTDILPSLALNVSLTDAQKVRISGTQTLSRPEYREICPNTFQGAAGTILQFGNPELERTLVRNLDARWEWYPNAGEILSLGVFAKQFTQPIEAIEVAGASAPQQTWVNADGAFNYGVEAELRKSLEGVADWLAPVGVFANGTLIRSEISIGEGTLSAQTNPDRPMVGQAPYVFNAGVAYTALQDRFVANLLFNAVGRRLSAAALAPLSEDPYVQPRQGLDLSLGFPLFRFASAKFDARNLLDSPFEVKQGNVVRERYTTGRVFSFGLTFPR